MCALHDDVMRARQRHRCQKKRSLVVHKTERKMSWPALSEAVETDTPYTRIAVSMFGVMTNAYAA